MNWLKQIFTKPKVSTARNYGRTEFDSEGFHFHNSEEIVQHMEWGKLDEVGILTTDEGPFAEDVFFMLLSEDGESCKIPQSAGGSEELVSRLQTLPDFDNDTLIEALGSTSNQQFKLWKKTPEQFSGDNGG